MPNNTTTNSSKAKSWYRFESVLSESVRANLAQCQITRQNSKAKLVSILRQSLQEVGEKRIQRCYRCFLHFRPFFDCNTTHTIFTLSTILSVTSFLRITMANTNPHNSDPFVDKYLGGRSSDETKKLMAFLENKISESNEQASPDESEFSSVPFIKYIDALVLDPTLGPDHESNRNFRKFLYCGALITIKERMNGGDAFGFPRPPSNKIAEDEAPNVPFRLPRPILRLLGNAQNAKDHLKARLAEMEVRFKMISDENARLENQNAVLEAVIEDFRSQIRKGGY